MRRLTLAEAADYLEAATVEQTIPAGHAVVNVGLNEFGVRFVLVNDDQEQTMVMEA